MKIPDAKAAVDKKWEKLKTIPAWDLGKVKSKKEVILEAQRDKHESPLCFIMDICHLKDAELEQIAEVSRQSRAQGRHCGQFWSLRSLHWTRLICVTDDAAKIMDVIARSSGRDGQVADAVSAYTHVKIGGRSKLLRIPKSECPDVWIRLPRHKIRTWMGETSELGMCVRSP